MTRLKGYVSNPVEPGGEDSQPFVALEYIESGTGRLLPGTELQEKSDATAVAHQRGDVRFGKLRPYLAKSLLMDAPGIGSGELLVLRPRPDALDSRFLWYLTLSKPFLEWAEVTSYGVKMPRTNWTLLGSWDAWIPSVDEQRQIVAYLDAETGRIDELLAEQRRFRTYSEERFIAAVSDLTSRGAKWRLKHLIAEPLAYGAAEVAEHGDPTWPRYIRTTDMTADGRLRPDTFCSLPPDVANPYLLREGDLLLTRSGVTVGKSFLYREEFGPACFAGYLIRARLNHIVLPQYLAHFTHSKAYWDQIAESAVQATIPNVSASRYAELVIPVPSAEEQELAVRRINLEEDRLHAISAELDEQERLLIEHRQALVTAAVTGQLHLARSAA